MLCEGKTSIKSLKIINRYFCVSTYARILKYCKEKSLKDHRNKMKSDLQIKKIKLYEINFTVSSLCSVSGLTKYYIMYYISRPHP